MTGLVLTAVILLAASGIAAGAAFRSRRLATAIAAAGGVAGCAVGAAGAFGVLMGRPSAEQAMAWAQPIGTLIVGVDALSALFLAPLFVLGMVTSIYGRAYLLGERGGRSLAAPSLLFNALIAAMALVVIARTAVLFLIAWELMTLSSYLLVTFEHESPSVRRAGWVYLVAGHVGVASLLALFLVLGRGAGALDFATFRAAASHAPVVVVFVLALCGFGVKAGLVPLHVWLPEAHAAAPSHVSALMSGVMIKIGLYGLLRTLTFVEPAGWWGPTLVVLGLAGALLGIALATCQRDLKRVLAYSSIENMGIVLLGLGVGYWGLAAGDVHVAALGFAGGLLHAWHHALMKGLLFLGAGSVLHGAGTRDLERLGGLLKRMRWTGGAMIVGAVAIAGLPPFAGFVGEWLIYLGLIGRGVASGGGGLGALLAVGALALVGAIALLCFVRLIGVVLLGTARDQQALRAHESSPSMTLPMSALVVAVVTVPFIPGYLLALQAPAVSQLAGADVAAWVVAENAALRPIVLGNAAVWVVVAIFGLALAAILRGRATTDETWACGYAAPTARMQYSGAALSQFFVAKLVPASLRPQQETLRSESAFPGPARFSSQEEDPITRSVYQPFFARWADRFAGLRWVQQGALHLYLLYIMAVVLAGLAWAALQGRLGT